MLRTDPAAHLYGAELIRKVYVNQEGETFSLRLVHGALQLRMEMVLPGWPGAADPRRHPESPSSPLGPARYAQGWFPVGALTL